MERPRIASETKGPPAWLLAGLAAAVVMGCGRPAPEPPAKPAPSPQATLPVTRSAKVTEKDLGVPFYPGSVEKGTASQIADSAASRMVMSDRTTKDAMEKVEAFYKSKVPGIHGGATSKTTMLLEGLLKNGSTVSIEIGKLSATQTEVFVTVNTVKKGAPDPNRVS